MDMQSSKRKQVSRTRSSSRLKKSSSLPKKVKQSDVGALPSPPPTSKGKKKVKKEVKEEVKKKQVKKEGKQATKKEAMSKRGRSRANSDSSPAVSRKSSKLDATKETSTSSHMGPHERRRRRTVFLAHHSSMLFPFLLRNKKKLSTTWKEVENQDIVATTYTPVEVLTRPPKNEGEDTPASTTTVGENGEEAKEDGSGVVKGESAVGVENESSMSIEPSAGNSSNSTNPSTETEAEKVSSAGETAMKIENVESSGVPGIANSDAATDEQNAPTVHDTTAMEVEIVVKTEESTAMENSSGSIKVGVDEKVNVEKAMDVDDEATVSDGDLEANAETIKVEVDEGGVPPSEEIVKEGDSSSSNEVSESSKAETAPIKLALRGYQVEGVKFILSCFNNGVSCILGDEMGLGKTIQSISFLYYLFKVKNMKGPHLIVVPLSVLHNWMGELRKWAPDMTFCKVSGSISERDYVFAKDEVSEGKINIYCKWLCHVHIVSLLLLSLACLCPFSALLLFLFLILLFFLPNVYYLHISDNIRSGHF